MPFGALRRVDSKRLRPPCFLPSTHPPVLSSSEKKAPGGREKRRERPRAMPPRRRREGTSIRARTEEPSSARVRVPTRQKASRSFRRCLPSRGGIRGRPRPERRRVKPSKLRHEPSRRPGCPERHEKGTRDVVQERAVRLGSSAPARNLPSRASGARRRKPSCGRSRLAGPRRGNAVVRPTQPASVGAGE
jgi:hypothetical protein